MPPDFLNIHRRMTEGSCLHAGVLTQPGFQVSQTNDLKSSLYRRRWISDIGRIIIGCMGYRALSR